MKACFCIVIVIVVLFVLSFSSATAQVSVSSVNDLQFDNVFQGVPKTVSKRTAGKAAEFQITGTAGTEVTIEFTLPSYMAALLNS